MEFIKSGWKTVVGAPTDGEEGSNQQQNVAETVMLFCYLLKIMFKIYTDTFLTGGEARGKGGNVNTS